MTAAIILAAGASTRLGSPKQLVTVEGETLLDRTIRVAREAGCSPVLVILGACASIISQACDLAGAVVLINEQWTEGMAASIRLGVQSLPAASASAIILSCDMPAVTSVHLRALKADGTLTASHYSGRNGIPAFFPRANFQDLLGLHGDKGARELLERSPSTVYLPGGELDIDTTADHINLLKSASPRAELS